MSAIEIPDGSTATKPPRRGRPPLPTAKRRAHRIVIHLDDATAEQLTAIAGPDRQPGRAAYDVLITALENTKTLHRTTEQAGSRPEGTMVDPNRNGQSS